MDRWERERDRSDMNPLDLVSLEISLEIIHVYKPKKFQFEM